MAKPKACRLPDGRFCDWRNVSVGPAIMFKCVTCKAMTDRVDDTIAQDEEAGQ